MTTEEALRPTAPDALQTPASLTERESQLLRQAGERVFALARKVSAAERREADLKRELEYAGRTVLSGSVSVARAGARLRGTF